MGNPGRGGSRHNGDMRRRSTWLPLALSALAHAAALLWLGGEARREPARTTSHAPRPGELAPTPVPSRPAPIEVELLHGDTLPSTTASVDAVDQPSAPALPVARRRQRRRAAAARVTTVPPGAGLGVDIGAPAPPGGDQRRPGDRTRRPGLPDPRAVARTVVPELGAPTRSPLELPQIGAPRAPRSEIQPDGTGEYGADDLTFHAHIKRDGRVAFTDKPNLHAHVHLPTGGAVKDLLERWYKDPAGVAEADPRAVETHTVTLLSGGFDVTNWAMRHAGADPYYARKKKFLDRTRGERMQMAANAQRENLRDAVAFLRGRLDKVWRDPTLTAAERRALLFALWDECAEEGSDQVVAAAEAARATIEAFIRRKLPAGSGDGFTDRELALLNQGRQSQRPFSPYRGPTENRKPRDSGPRVDQPPPAP